MSCAASSALRDLRNAVTVGDRGDAWCVTDGLVLRDGCVFVLSTSSTLHDVLQRAHTANHEGVEKTFDRLHATFYVKHDQQLVRDFFHCCTTCQWNKSESLHPAGLLEPLLVPSRVWADISMDFVEALPKVHSKSVILTVVDRFSKYTHFIPLGHLYTASSVARAFFNDIVRLHGFPDSIVSDRDPVFTGHVWRDLFQLAGVRLRLSTAFYPQPKASPKQRTRPSQCTSAASLVIGRKIG